MASNLWLLCDVKPIEIIKWKVVSNEWAYVSMMWGRWGVRYVWRQARRPSPQRAAYMHILPGFVRIREVRHPTCLISLLFFRFLLPWNFSSLLFEMCFWLHFVLSKIKWNYGTTELELIEKWWGVSFELFLICWNYFKSRRYFYEYINDEAFIICCKK